MFGHAVKEIGASDLAQWLEAEHPIRVLDVRQMEEIVHGTVPKAQAFPLHTLPMRVHELSKNEKTVIVCRSGARSAQACLFLQQQGFDNVFNLRGGMIGWVQSGYAPVPLN